MICNKKARRLPPCFLCYVDQDFIAFNSSANWLKLVTISDVFVVMSLFRSLVSRVSLECAVTSSVAAEIVSIP